MVDALPGWASREEREGRGMGCLGPQMPSTGCGHRKRLQLLGSCSLEEGDLGEESQAPRALSCQQLGGRQVLSLQPWQLPGMAESVGSLFGKNSVMKHPSPLHAAATQGAL